VASKGFALKDEEKSNWYRGLANEVIKPAGVLAVILKIDSSKVQVRYQKVIEDMLSEIKKDPKYFDELKNGMQDYCLKVITEPMKTLKLEGLSKL